MKKEGLTFQEILDWIIISEIRGIDPVQQLKLICMEGLGKIKYEDEDKNKESKEKSKETKNNTNNNNSDNRSAVDVILNN